MLLASLLGLLVGRATAAKEVSSIPVASATIDGLREAIDRHIGEPRFAHAHWGIAIQSLDNGSSLYRHNADQLLQPASTAKLFTAALTLSALGPDYRIGTRVLATEPIRQGRLDGPLVLYGMGDPTLGTDASPDWADQLANQLLAKGLQTIHGDLIADDTYFATPPMGSGWEAIDLQSWFAVPTSALSVQENEYALTITPGNAIGAPAQLAVKSIEVTPRLVNHLPTAAAHTRSDINLYRAPGDATLYAFGSIPLHASWQTFRLAMADPAWQAGAMLAHALAQHGIRLEGSLRSMHWPRGDDLPAQTTLLAQVFSPPVSEILHNGLKRSQNLYLQNLLLLSGVQAQSQSLQAAAPPNGFITTEAWGIRAMHQLLDRIGIAPAEALLQEGTGLSRGDLVTPNATVRLLAYLAGQSYADQLRDDLPIAGVDGTLIGRLRHTPAANNLRAKTGSMNFDHCLAGYVTTAAGERLAFAIMLNNYDAPGDSPSASRDVDAIAAMLAGLHEHSR